MKVNPNCSDINVKSSLKDKNSILNFYKQLIEFRKGNEIIRDGSYKEYFPNNKKVFCFERALGNKRYIVICNFKEKKVPLTVDEINAKGAKLRVCNWPGQDKELGDAILLRPYEAVVYEIK